MSAFFVTGARHHTAFVRRRSVTFWRYSMNRRDPIMRLVRLRMSIVDSLNLPYFKTYYHLDVHMRVFFSAAQFVCAARLSTPEPTCSICFGEAEPVARLISPTLALHC